MQNSIERSISIQAPLDRVWDLVTEPGWWVPTDQPVHAERVAGEIVDRVSEKHGRYPIEVVDLRPMSYAAFRWASAFAPADLAPGRTTLVEFTLAESDSGVEVTVVESGFADLEAPDEVKAHNVETNTGGWTAEMDSLRSRAES